MGSNKPNPRSVACSNVDKTTVTENAAKSFEAVAVVKGVPAASLAYHNLSGVLLDNDESIFGGEALGAFDDSAEADVEADTQTAGGSDNAVRGSGGARESGSGGDDVGAGSSRFRCHPQTFLE